MILASLVSLILGWVCQALKACLVLGVFEVCQKKDLQFLISEILVPVGVYLVYLVLLTLKLLFLEVMYLPHQIFHRFVAKALEDAVPSMILVLKASGPSLILAFHWKFPPQLASRLYEMGMLVLEVSYPLRIVLSN